jgi:diacylglycerol kinase family enzyme
MLSPVESQFERAPRPRLALPVVEPDPNRIAVLLNRNARKVTDKLAKRIERIVGSDHVYYSHSLDEAEAFTREIVQRGYGTILSGGGDGTLCRTVNLVQRYIDESNAWRTERAVRYGERQSLIGAPRFGFLRLGTGNGMTRVVGAQNPIRDLQAIVDYAPGRTHSIPLIESEGERFFFSGLGYDSMILNDYNSLKEATKSRFLKPFMHGLTGYFAALFARTLPGLLLRGMHLEASVVNRGRAFYVDPRRGDAAVEVEPGATLFEGKARIIAAATSPFYGYGFKLFPFANIMPGMMHLRIATLGPLTSLGALPRVWNGSYRNPKHIFDFLVEDVHVELNDPFPYQHSGDAQGMRDAVDWRIADKPLRMVDCHKPRQFGN